MLFLSRCVFFSLLPLFRISLLPPPHPFPTHLPSITYLLPLLLLLLWLLWLLLLRLLLAFDVEEEVEREAADGLVVLALMTERA